MQTTNDITIIRDVNRFPVSSCRQDTICPHPVLVLCHQGSSRAIYDLKEVTHSVNRLAIILPGHLIRILDTSPDYKATMLIISSETFKDLRFHTFSHNDRKSNLSPLCPLTGTQAAQMMGLLEQLETIAAHNTDELPNRYKMLLSVLAVGYEYIHLYRREQDRQTEKDRPSDFFNRFCQLVTEHYTESREVAFYAGILNLHPKYFSRVTRTVMDGLTPKEWIEQYVAAQAKRLIELHPSQSLKQTSLQLGFTEPTSFYRYFKHATGMTAKEYKDQVLYRPSE